MGTGARTAGQRVEARVSGVEDLFSEREEVEMWQAIGWHHVRRLVVHTFRNFRPLVENRRHYFLWAGLIRRVDGLAIARGIASAKPPLGWSYQYEWDRDCMLLMPLWLLPAFLLWRNWPRYVFRPLMRCGLWKVDEGCYYHSGRWAWADAYAAGMPRWSET